MSKRHSVPEQMQPAAGTLPKTMTRERIAVRAYEIWMERGCRDGNDQNDWFEAERQLNGHTAPESTARPAHRKG